MSKLHEILAIKSGVTGKFQKLKSDLVDLFTNKKLHFTKKITTYKPLDENQKEVTEENIVMQTTVRKELTWIGNEFAKLVDYCHTINVTNQSAKADVLVNDVVVLRSIPVTGLLELEKLVTSFKELIIAVPTLDPVKGFVLDKDSGEGIYKALLRTSSRTAKEFYAFVLSVATDKHPANVTEKSRDVIVGYKEEMEWSGMFTPAEKSEMISRCEDLLQGIKSAQSRANNIDVTGDKIGESVVKHILG